MGGGAIRDPKTHSPITRRLERQDYLDVRHQVLARLAADGIVAEAVLELPGKTSFGDLDVLYVGPQHINDMRHYVTATFGVEAPWHIVTNGAVMSMAVPLRCSAAAAGHDSEELTMESSASVRFLRRQTAADDQQPPRQEYFQIDFIRTTTREHLDTARFYFSYSDVGSIIGRVVNHYGLKFGDAGLWCAVLENTVFPDRPFDVRHNFGRLSFSTDVQEILTFLDLDYSFWKDEIPKMQSVDDHCRIFAWLAASKFFKPEIFCTLNTDHRARAGKRPFYQQFLAFVGVTEVKPVGSDKHSEMGREELSLQNAAVAYFHREQELQALVAQALAQEARHAKFQGLDVLQEYVKQRGEEHALRGAAAGRAIQAFQAWCTTADAAHQPAADTCADTVLTPWEQRLDAWSREEVLAKVSAFVAQMLP